MTIWPTSTRGNVIEAAQVALEDEDIDLNDNRTDANNPTEEEPNMEDLSRKLSNEDLSEINPHGSEATEASEARIKRAQFHLDTSSSSSLGTPSVSTPSRSPIIEKVLEDNPNITDFFNNPPVENDSDNDSNNDSEEATDNNEGSNNNDNSASSSTSDVTVTGRTMRYINDDSEIPAGTKYAEEPPIIHNREAKRILQTWPDNTTEILFEDPKDGSIWRVKGKNFEKFASSSDGEVFYHMKKGIKKI